MKEKNWKDEVDDIMREDRLKAINATRKLKPIWYGERKDKMIKLVEQEKQKSYEEGYKECGKDVIEVLEEINRNTGKMDEEYFGK
jgi:hypothetical protein